MIFQYPLFEFLLIIKESIMYKIKSENSSSDGNNKTQ